MMLCGEREAEAFGGQEMRMKRGESHKKYLSSSQESVGQS